MPAIRQYQISERQTVSMTALFMRWLVVLVIALDLLSAPMHSHFHDVGADAHVAEAHIHGDSDGADSELMLHAEDMPAHVLLGHSVAAIRSTHETQQVDTPEIHLVLSLAPPPAMADVGGTVSREDWALPDHIPALDRRSLRPEGRAPPSTKQS